MATAVLLQPIRVATRCADKDGQLVLADGELVAVLVRLADAAHGRLVGSWYLEAGFGACAAARPPVFDTFEAAQTWIRCRLAG